MTNYELLAIALGSFSIAVAFFSLWWSIYRDIALKPKLKVKFSVKTIISDEPNPLNGETVLIISAVNHGPGKIRIILPYFVRKKSFLRKTKHGQIISQYYDLLEGELPCMLEKGDPKDFMLKFSEEGCQNLKRYTQIGLRDSFDRIHWASRKHFRAVLGTCDLWFPPGE